MRAAVAEREQLRLLGSDPHGKGNLGPMFAVVEREVLHDTVKASMATGSPRGRGPHGDDAQPRVWRAMEVSQGSLMPTAWQPLLCRLGSFDRQGPPRKGFCTPAYLSEKTKELVDPYDIQRDDYTG